MPAFLRVTDAETGAERLINPAFVIYAERDHETQGAVVWWVSYRDAGQPQSRYLLTREPADEVFAALEKA